MARNKKSAGLIPAVIYARFSSSGQREESITGQVRECTAWAERNGYDVIKTYEDRARTGTNDRRPAFQQMVRDAKKKTFSAVIVWKMDRFSRSRYDAAIYKAQLSKLGIRVFSAMEPITDGPESIIVEGLLESMAEFYSRNLSQNVKRGNYDSALAHKTVGQRFLGYRPDAADHFEVDPETAPVVKRIFSEYVSGRSVRDICDGLNADGIRTRTGGLFDKSAIPRILKNERYTGVYIFSDLVRDEGGMPAIIDRETFDRAQALLAQRKHAPAASRDVRYLLTGKIFCGECGSPMIGESARSATGRQYCYYSCTGRLRQKSCDLDRVQKDLIEDRVVSLLSEKINDDAFVESLADLAVRAMEAEAEDLSEVRALEAELRDVSGRISNLSRVLETGTTSRVIVERLEDLETQRDGLLQALRRMEAERDVVDREEIIFFLEKMRGDPSDPEYREKLVRLFLNAVYVYKNGRLSVAINFLGEDGQPVSFDAVSGSSLSHLAGQLILKTKTGRVMVFSASLK